MTTKVIPQGGTQLFDTAVFNAQVPKEGPKAAGVSLPFDGTVTEVDINLLLTETLQFMSLVQAIYVDNSANPQELTITVSVLEYSMKVPGNSQAFLPLMVPTRAVLKFKSNAVNAIPIVLLNVPVPAVVWGV